MSLFTCSHLPPWREGWISARRKSPQKSKRMFLLAISLQNAPPLSRSAGFILFWIIISRSPRSQRVVKKDKRYGTHVIKRGQWLLFSGSLCFFPPVCVWCCCFYSGDSCQQHRHCCQQGKKVREGKRRTHTYAYTHTRAHAHTNTHADPLLIQKELKCLPSICMDIQHTYLQQSGKRVRKSKSDQKNYLLYMALIFSSLLFNTSSHIAFSRFAKVNEPEKFEL